ncbi:MAG: SRPBCC domain-containing protein [Gammaproteobacteria bacterium]
MVEPHLDGRYSYGWSYDVRGNQVEGGPTRILEVVENSKLVTDWPDWRGEAHRPAQRVSWVLEAIGEQTRVTLIHEPFERTTDVSDYPQGWAQFLARLKQQVESTAT